jgi:hypothetical protein
VTPPHVEQAVLVGGTGRSGTTIAGRVLNQHPALALTRSREVRFLTGAGGLIAALGSAVPSDLAPVDPATFAENLRGRFYRWRKPSGIHEGLYRTVHPEVVDDAVASYLAHVDGDPLGASREVVFAILPHTLQHPDRRWIDTTPTNVLLSRALHTLLPEARIVHMMRDGRDVAVSFAGKKFGPDDPREALELWGERMMRANAEESVLEPGVVTRVDLADWVGPEALDHLRELCTDLGLERDDGFEVWFTKNVTSEGMHPGRWRAELDTRTATELDRRYDEWCSVLTEHYPQFPLPRPS